VASYLLDIPRGVSCYADHLLKDYGLKVVPLHLRHCAIVVATSDRIREELLSLAPDMNPATILVKPNGINAAHFPTVARTDPTPGEPFTLVTVCRIEPKKGLIYLVEAMGQLRDQGVPVRLHVLGGIDDSESSRAYDRDLRERIESLRLGEVVRLEGRQTEEAINQFFAQAQVFVAPFIETNTGDKDGIPTSLLEGMASGLPVVATDAGSIAEVIADGQDGVIVPQRDPAALADTIGALLLDPARRAGLGAQAGRRVRQAFDAASGERALHERLDRLRASAGPRAAAPART
jgi:glycosyltransferase involved in cell wall biosynthesis